MVSERVAQGAAVKPAHFLTKTAKKYFAFGETEDDCEYPTQPTGARVTRGRAPIPHAANTVVQESLAGPQRWNSAFRLLQRN